MGAAFVRQRAAGGGEAGGELARTGDDAVEGGGLEMGDVGDGVAAGDAVRFQVAADGGEGNALGRRGERGGVGGDVELVFDFVHRVLGVNDAKAGDGVQAGGVEGVEDVGEGCGIG